MFFFFLMNWIRGGVREVGDLTFRIGVLDERSMYHTIICKKKMYIVRLRW